MKRQNSHRNHARFQRLKKYKSCNVSVHSTSALQAQIQYFDVLDFKYKNKTTTTKTTKTKTQREIYSSLARCKYDIVNRTEPPKKEHIYLRLKTCKPPSRLASVDYKKLDDDFLAFI
jgi:hypothetical protein